ADSQRIDVEAQSQAETRQPQPVPEIVRAEPESNQIEAVEPAPVDEPVPAVESFAKDEPETAELVTEVAALDASTEVDVERPTPERADPASDIPEPEPTGSPGGLGGQRAAIKGQPVDWAAVRREAAVPN